MAHHTDPEPPCSFLVTRSLRNHSPISFSFLCTHNHVELLASPKFIIQFLVSVPANFFFLKPHLRRLLIHSQANLVTLSFCNHYTSAQCTTPITFHVLFTYLFHMIDSELLQVTTRFFSSLYLQCQHIIGSRKIIIE